MTTQATDWSLQTHGDSWSGVSRIVDEHGLIVATGPEHHLKRILREHEQHEPLREALAVCMETLKEMRHDSLCFSHNKWRFPDAKCSCGLDAALAACRAALGEE